MKKFVKINKGTTDETIISIDDITYCYKEDYITNSESLFYIKFYFGGDNITRHVYKNKDERDKDFEMLSSITCGTSESISK